MIDLFRHILDLDFEWLFATYDSYVYVILFAIVFIETGLVVMPFLPGDSLLFTAGLFANQLNQATGEPFLNIFYLLTLLFAAAVLGDSTNYFIGRNIGLRMLKLRIRGRALVKQEYLDKTHTFYEKYGTKTIIMARFVPIVRTFAPFVAGIAEMNYSRFLPFDLVGGALWVFALTSAGYFLGEFEIIRSNIELVALVIIFISVFPIIFEYIKHRLGKA